jgi:hypothetical protein
VAADTQIIISAVDRTGSAVASVTKGLDSIKGSFGGLQAAIATLGGLGAVAMFTNWAKETVGAAAALDDLADATGSSVDNLSKLANIAQVSGASFDTIDGAIKKLAVGMAGVDEESSRAGKALAAIGVQSRDPAQALTEIAQKFATYEDGANKAALAVAIFGKSGASLLPVLKDIAENVDIAGTVTAQQAKAAEDLEKSYRRLGVAASGFKAALLDDVVPALTASITSFNLARAAGLGFLDSVLMTGNYGPEGIAKAINEAAASVAELKNRIDDPNTSDSFVLKLNAQLEVAEKRLKALQAIQASINGPAWDKAYPSRNSSGRQTEAPVVPGADPKTKAAIDYYLKGLGDIADALKAEDEARKKTLEGYRQQLELIDKLYESNAKNLEAIESTTAGYQKQINSLTLTKDELYALDIAKLQAIVDARLYEGYINAETEALIKQLDTLKKLRGVESAHDASEAAKKSAEEWQRAADSIQNSLTDALLRGFESGKDWAKNFVDTLKNMFGSLVLRPIIQAIVAPAAGGITSMFSGSASASGGGGLGGAGNLFNLGGGSWLSGIGDSIFGGGGGAAFGAGFSAPLDTLAAIFAGGGEFASGSMALASGLGAAVPVIGAALAIGSIVKSFLDSKKGGPKSGGYGTAGDITGVNRGDLFTPNQADSSAAGIAKTTLAAFNATLKAVGGSGSGGFDIGFNSDPQGTAPNQLGVRAMVNGQQVYGYSAGDSLGRDDATLQAAINLETKRALLAALQASDLPDQIAAVFDSITASGASSETIDNLMAFGTAMKTVIDAIGGDVAADAETAWAQSQRTSVEVLRDMGVEVIRLADNMDGTVGSMQDLATATTNYRQAVTQTLIALQQMKVDIDALFSSTRESLTTYGMSPLDTYNYYRSDANTAYAELLTTTDPARVQILSNRINNDINAAFSALPEDDKLGMRGPLLTFLNDVNAIVTGFGDANPGNSVIDRIWDIVVHGTVDPFAAANTALDGAATKFVSASDAVGKGADKFSTAVDKFAAALPLQVRVQVNQLQAAEVGG